MLMTRTRYATHRGCDLRAVSQALEANRIHAEASGLIESTQADKDWDRNTDVMRSRILPRESSTSARGVQGERQPITIAYLEQRTEQAKVMVEAKRLDIEIRKRTLEPAADLETAERRVYGRIRALRDACLEIPDRLSSVLAAEKDPHVVRERIQRELISIFDRFASSELPVDGEAVA